MSFTQVLIAQEPPLKGDDVGDVQGWLNMNQSGSYDYATANAVKTFKTAHGLRQDGIVNEITWKTLELTAKKKAQELQPADNFHKYVGKAKLQFHDQAGNPGLTNAENWWLRLFRNAAPHDLLWEGKTNAAGDCVIEFLENNTTTQPIECILLACAEDNTLSPSSTLTIPWANPAAPPLPPTGQVTIIEYSVQGKFLNNSDNVTADEVKFFQRSLRSTGIYEESPVTGAIAVVEQGKRKYTVTYPPVAAPPLQAVPDIVVKAYRNGAQHAIGSTAIYNSRPVEGGVNIECPPEGVWTNPDLNGEPFHEWTERLQNLMGLMNDTELTTFATGVFTGSEPNRKNAIQHLAANLVIDRAGNPPPADTNKIPHYEAENDRKIRETAVQVERVLRALHLSQLAAADLTTIPGFEVRLPFAEDKKLSLILNRKEAPPASSPLPTKIFYALLPATSLSMSSPAVLNMLRLEKTARQRALIEKAKLDGLILKLAIESDDKIENTDALVALAELRDKLKSEPDWQIEITATNPSEDEKSALTAWLSAEDQSAEDWQKFHDTTPAAKDLEWLALTFNIQGTAASPTKTLATALKDLIPQNPDIRALSTLDDRSLREAVLPFAEFAMDPSQAWKGWPKNLQDTDPKRAAGKWVEWLRTFAPFAGNIDSLDDLETICLGIESVIVALRELNGNTVRKRSDLAEVDRLTIGKLLWNAATRSQHECYRDWPDPIRKEDAYHSAEALCNLILDDEEDDLLKASCFLPEIELRVQLLMEQCEVPSHQALDQGLLLATLQEEAEFKTLLKHADGEISPAELLNRLRPADARRLMRMFLGFHPYFSFDISPDELATLVGTAAEPHRDLTTLSNEPAAANHSIAKSCAKNFEILRLLWELTQKDRHQPGLRTKAVEWLVEKGKTTQGLVKLAAIGNAPDTLKPILQRAKEAAGAPAAPEVEAEQEAFSPVNDGDELIDCECEAWRAPTSAASYLVDLVKFLSKTGAEVDFQYRRPDISPLTITEANSTTLIPEIDLGNELLESLAAGLQPAPHATDKGKSEADLLLHPEHSTPNTAFPCYDQLMEAKSPIPLPYDQRLDIVRTYLGAYGTNRQRVLANARKDISWHQDPHELREPESEDLAFERLVISPEEADIFKQQPDAPDTLAEHYTYPEQTPDTTIVEALKRLPVFLDKTGLSREEAAALLNHLPAWLPITSDPLTSAWGCQQSNIKVTGLDAAILHRLHRYLR